MTKTILEDNMTKLMNLDEDEKSMVEILDDDAEVPTKAKDVDRDQTDDLKYVRDNIRELIDNGAYALDDLANVARTSESPRAYEVLSTMMKTLLDANKDLVDMHKRKKELSKEQSKTNSDGTRIQNNSIFVGTTAELQQFIRKQQDETNND